MNDFNQMFQQAVAIKSHEMHSKRKVFEKQPLFIKAGLYYLNEYKDQRKLEIEDRLKISEELKDKGNELFKENKFSNASHEYEKSLSIFLYIENKNQNWKNEGIIDDDLTYMDEGEDQRVQNLRIKLLLNLAICYLKEKQWKDAIAACDFVLNIEQNSKAFFRRAKARLNNINSEENDYELAIQDLEQALSLDDDDSIRKELSKAKLDLKSMKRQNINISKTVVQNIQKTTPIQTNQNKTEEIQNDEDTSSDEEDNYEYSEDWKKHGFKTLHYEPSYEEDHNKQPPEEIIEFGKFIESRGVNVLHLYESQGKQEEAQKHRDFLSQLMAAKVKIERVSKSDFTKPILNEKAQQFGIDLNDQNVQQEFQHLLQQNLQDLRKWLKEQNWKMRKRKILNQVNKLAEQAKEDKLVQEIGANTKYDYIVLVICSIIILISSYYYIF